MIVDHIGLSLVCELGLFPGDLAFRQQAPAASTDVPVAVRQRQNWGLWQDLAVKVACGPAWRPHGHYESRARENTVRVGKCPKVSLAGQRGPRCIERAKARAIEPPHRIEPAEFGQCVPGLVCERLLRAGDTTLDPLLRRQGRARLPNGAAVVVDPIPHDLAHQPGCGNGLDVAQGADRLVHERAELDRAIADRQQGAGVAIGIGGGHDG